MRPTQYEEIIARIVDWSNRGSIFGIEHGLMHGYIGLLHFDELVSYTLNSLELPSPARRAIHGRLIRECHTDAPSREQIDLLGERLLNSTPSNLAGRRTRDSLLSHVYLELLPELRKDVLERWQGNKGKDAAGRWLKAISSDELHFDEHSVLTYWQASSDDRAAKVLAYKARPDLINEILSDLIQRCSIGWIVSKAALRSRLISDDDWMEIRNKFPSTYAYLCAKTGRELNTSDALQILRECDPFDREQGLALWAFGRVGLWTALEAVSENIDSFRPQLHATQAD